MAAGREGKEGQAKVVGILDRMLRKSKSDSPEKEMIVVVGLRRALKLGGLCLVHTQKREPTDLCDAPQGWVGWYWHQSGTGRDE